MADAAAVRTREALPAFGQGFLRDVWYFAALSGDLKPGALARHEILGEPVLLGRTRTGQAFALRDICPHRAAPLSAGRLVKDGAGEAVECPYHGWTLPPGRGLLGHPLAGGGPGAGGRAHSGAPLSAGREPGPGVRSGWRPTRAARASRTSSRPSSKASSAAGPSSSTA